MTAIIACALLVAFLDQVIKLLILRRLKSATVPLGVFGRLEAVRSRLWFTRAGLRQRPATVLSVWFLAAANLMLMGVFLPIGGWFAGALIGGSLSNAVEISLRGFIVDYVRPRFLPAFNLADVAITAGALGLLGQAALMAKAILS